MKERDKFEYLGVDENNIKMCLKNWAETRRID